jgi:hypothetical protein
MLIVRYLTTVECAKDCSRRKRTVPTSSSTASRCEVTVT